MGFSVSPSHIYKSCISSGNEVKHRRSKVLFPERCNFPHFMCWSLPAASLWDQDEGYVDSQRHFRYVVCCIVSKQDTTLWLRFL